MRNLTKRLAGSWGIFAIWVLLCVVLVVTGWNNIRIGVGWDPDDQLRLVQLRDFLNGQGWFDNRQYRLNPPDGAPMHWSRLVELALAVLVILCTPIFGQEVAEIIASTAVPLLLLGGIIFLLARMASGIGGPTAGIAAAIIASLLLPLVMQLRPMRIDHHGWQIFTAVVALASLFHANVRKSGIALGLALAVWLHISLEGAPMSAAFFLFLGWKWLTHPNEGKRLFWTIGAFAVASLALFLGTQAQGLRAAVYCDTISPPHIWAILAASAIMLPGVALTPRKAFMRALIMFAAGSVATALITLRTPECLTGAFSTLDPLVREYWYIYVMEGMPVWRQDSGTAAILLSGPVVGIASSLYLIFTAKEQDRPKLIALSFFALYGVVLSLLVFRTVSVAAAYAVVPTAILVADMFARYRQEAVPLRRIVGVVAMLALVNPGTWVGSAVNLSTSKQTAQLRHGERNSAACETASSVAALGQLQKGRFIAPFDMAPMILARTPHSVLASSHHRNEAAMHDHIQIFRSSPEISYQLLKKRRIDYVAVCAGEEELANYARKDPKGLWAQMADGRVPEWLTPLPVMGKGIEVWRVR